MSSPIFPLQKSILNKTLILPSFYFSPAASKIFGSVGFRLIKKLNRRISWNKIDIAQRLYKARVRAVF